MKYLMTLLICCVFFLTKTASAQEAKKAQEPEYIGVFAVLDAKGSLSALERQTPENKIKVKALGFGGGSGYLQIKGDQSSVRFKADQKLEFVVRVASQAVDPVSIIQFFRFESVKGARRLQMSKVGIMAIGAKTTTSESAVQFNVAKYGESSFKIVPASVLSTGEYCLSGPGTSDGFCFGVDAAGAGK